MHRFVRCSDEEKKEGQGGAEEKGRWQTVKEKGAIERRDVGRGLQARGRAQVVRLSLKRGVSML
jgi:hypothetical protein